MRIRVVLLVAVSFVGCGALGFLPSKQAKCDLRPKGDQCTDIRDYKGPSLVTFEGVCTTLTKAKGGGTYTENAICDSATSLGGCQAASADGSKQTNWYYTSSGHPDKASAQAECESGQSFVEP